MKLFIIRWTCILWLLMSISFVSAQGAIQDATRKNAILIAEAKMKAAARLSTMSTSIVIATPTAPALAPAFTNKVAPEDIPGFWANSFWQAEYFSLLHSLRDGHTRSSSNASSPSTCTSSSQGSSHSAASDSLQEGTKTPTHFTSLNSLLARINRFETACFSGKLKNCRLSKNWRAQEDLEEQKSEEKRRDFDRNLWCKSEKDRFEKVVIKLRGEKEGYKVEGKSEKKAQLEEARLRELLEAERELVMMGCAISKRTIPKEWRRWDLIRNQLNPADYEAKFPGWAGLIVGVVLGLLIAGMAVGVVWRWYALEVGKVVCARAAANARQIGRVRGRSAVSREGAGERRRRDVVDRPPPYAALELLPPAYVEMTRLGGD